MKIKLHFQLSLFARKYSNRLSPMHLLEEMPAIIDNIVVSKKTSYMQLTSESFCCLSSCFSRKSKIFFTIITFLYTINSIYSQPIDPGKKPKIDSIKLRLKKTTNDSLKISLKVEIAELEFATRFGLWDSLLSESDRKKINFFKPRIYNNLGFIALSENNSAKARFFFEKAIETAQKFNNKSELLSPIYNLIAIVLKENNYKKVIELAYKGLKVATEIKNNDFISAFNTSIANCYFAIGEPSKALAVHVNAYELIKYSENKLAIAGLLFDISSDYEVLKDTSNCIKYALLALNAIRTLKESTFNTEIYICAGVAYTMKHNYDSASYYFEKAYELSKKYNNLDNQAAVLIHLGYTEFLKNNLREAEKLAIEADNLLELSKNKYLKTGNYLVLKKIFLANGNYKEALNYYEKHIASRDSAKNEKNRKMAMQKQFDYELEKKENENKLLAQQNQIQSLELKQSHLLAWALGGFVLLVMVITILFIRQNRLRALQKNTQLEHNLLRTQMNPHFIFNSLQAIQNFILKNDKKDAVGYLSSFAHVMRNVLENSRLELIPLKKEISMLQDYLKLQKLRFGNRFDFEIHVDEIIEPDAITIPPMLTQPFIENAVEHGIYGFESGGKIHVNYRQEGNYLIMEIIDNGAGMKYDYTAGKTHRSLAIEITRERVALMNKKNETKTTFNIEEAFPSEPERKGVKVIFKLSV